MAAKLISTGHRHTTLPGNYVRPVSDRPRLSEVSQLKDFPLIDLSSTDRSLLVQQIHLACARFGFFQVSYIIISLYTFRSRMSFLASIKDNMFVYIFFCIWLISKRVIHNYHGASIIK